MYKSIALSLRNIGQSSFVVGMVMKLSPEIKKLKRGVPVLPERVQVMTMTRCNYKCDFCPNKTIIHPPGKMSIEMYNKILDELGQDWDGLFMPYLQNEPFLDVRLPELLKLTKSKLPRCSIEIQTNGSLLNKELIEKVLPYVDTLKVNDYTEDFNVIERIKKYNIKSDRLILAQRCPKGEKLTNRAGNVKYGNIKKKKLPINKFCIYPFKTIYINFEGKVITCCMDWRHQYILGDLNNNSLKDTWNNENFRMLRKSLSKSNRSHPLCQKCDFDGYSMGDVRRKFKGVYKFAEDFLYGRHK